MFYLVKRTLAMRRTMNVLSRPWATKGFFSPHPLENFVAFLKHVSPLAFGHLGVTTC